MHLYDLLDLDEMTELTRDGYVREQFHPHEPLAILNYSDKAQIEGQTFWENYPSLSYCRGLIYNTDNGEIVARPFPKFWNYGQGAAAKIDLHDFVAITDKVDGSLGILYRRPSDGFWAIATRGSFMSEQAQHATELLGDKYADWHPKDPDYTLLFEIVYPENRIVLNYGDVDDLYMLGSVHKTYGTVIGAVFTGESEDWPGPLAVEWPAMRLADVIALPPRPNSEGYVLRKLLTNDMVKIKQEDYVVLHRLVTGLNERRVWQALMAGQTVDQINEPLPDEFHPWVRDVATKLLRRFDYEKTAVETDYNDAMAFAANSGALGPWGEIVDRKEIALLFQQRPNPGLLFALLDDRDISQKIWKQLEPKGDVRPHTPKED